MDSLTPESRLAAFEPAVRIRVLGGVEVARRGEAPQRIRGRMAHLLAVLAEAAPRGVQRADLIDLLWNGAAGDQSGGLDPLLSRLRRIVGPIEGRGQVRLATTAETDVAAARAQLLAAEMSWPGDPEAAFQAATAAAALLSEELLPGVDEQWIAERRRRLALQRDAARVLSARAALRLGGEALERGSAAASALVADDPLDEVGYELLMRCQLAAGREGSALSTYARAEAALSAVLGGQPGRALGELRREAQRAQPAEAGPGALGTLPVALARERRIQLVGREAELASLLAACSPAAPGGVVVIEGPSGIGKTRLLAELGAELVAAGGLVLHGRALQTEPLPFGALVHALRPITGVRPGDETEPVGPDDSPDPAIRRFRAFERIRQAVTAAAPASAAPFVLLLDDAQWLDGSSAELLAHLTREQASPLRVVLAQRTADAEHPVPAALVQTAAGTGRAITLTGPSPLMRRSADDLGASIVDAADLDPATAAALGRVDVAVRQLVHLIAVGGDALTLAELSAVLGCSAGEVEAMAAQAFVEGVLEEPGEAGQAGRLHDARRQAVLRTAPAPAIQSAHRSIAGALESLLDPAAEADGVQDWLRVTGARLADHWRRAGGAVAQRRAARYGARAAEVALEGLAFEKSASLAARAREDLRASSVSATALEADELGLLLLEGQALNAASMLAAARPVWLEAIALARSTGSPEEEATAVLGLGGPRLGGALRDPDFRGALEAALDRPPADPSLQARLRSRLAGELVDGPVDRRRALADEAIAIARASGSGVALAEALLWRHLVKVSDAEHDGRAALADEAEHAAREAGRLDLALHARMVRFSDLVEEGRIDDAEQELAGWEAEATSGVLPYNRWAAAVCAPSIALARCDVTAAIEGIRLAEELAAPLGDDWMVRSAIGGQWLTVFVVQGDTEALRATLEPLVASDGAIAVWAAALALGELVAGNDARALELVGEAMRSGAEAMVDALRLPTLSFLALVASTAGASEETLRALRTAIEPHASSWATQHYGGATHGPLALRLALLEIALGDVETARARIAPFAPGTGEGSRHGGEELVGLTWTHVTARILAATGEIERAQAMHRELAQASRAGGALGWAALFERGA